METGLKVGKKHTAVTQQGHFTGAAESGKDLNAEGKKGDKEMLAVAAQEASRIVIAPKLTTVHLPLYLHLLAPTNAKTISRNCSINDGGRGPSCPSHCASRLLPSIIK